MKKMGMYWLGILFMLALAGVTVISCGKGRTYPANANGMKF